MITFSWWRGSCLSCRLDLDAGEQLSANMLVNKVKTITDKRLFFMIKLFDD
jgi:hypothetical protein